MAIGKAFSKGLGAGLREVRSAISGAVRGAFSNKATAARPLTRTPQHTKMGASSPPAYAATATHQPSIETNRFTHFANSSDIVPLTKEAAEAAMAKFRQEFRLDARILQRSGSFTDDLIAGPQ